MKIRASAAIGIALLAALMSLTACSKSAENAMTESGAASAASGASGAMHAGLSLMNQLGGITGVTKLADAFGANISANPILSKVLDAAAITQTKNGLVNEIAKVSGMAAPNPGADMLGALTGKGLDAQGVNELTGALSSAADQVKVGGPQKSALMALLTPITNTLLAKQ